MSKVSFSTSSSPFRTAFRQNPYLQLLSILFLLVWAYAWFNNHNMENWIIENLLVIIFLIILVVSYTRFRFSDLSYSFFFVYLLLHCYGAFYAYTDNALGAWLQEKYLLQRNPYDRIVHFSFGLLVVYPACELLIRQFKIPTKRAQLYAVEAMFSLGTLFEMVEWAVAECTDSETGATYVATQGDVWDAHKDIMLAALGATITMILRYLYKRNQQNSRIA